MRISFEEKNGISIFKISGDIDIETSPDMKKSFDKAITGNKKKVVISLKDVNYIDSSGLATLVEILKNLRARGSELKLSDLSVKVRGLFEITKLDRLFSIFPNEDDAFSSF